VDLLLITQLFPPESAAGANRTGAMADALAKRFKVRVATLEPGYPDAALYSTSDWRADDVARGFAVSRRPAFRPHEASLVKRALREIDMSLSLVRSAQGPADLVLVSTPSMFLAPAAWLAARFRRARFVWDVRDLTWRYAQESVKTSGPQGAVLRVLEAFMLGLLRRSDLVIAATAGLADVLQRQGVPASRMITVPNGVSRTWLDACEPIAATGPTSAERPRVTYVGLMGYNHGIGILIDVAAQLPHVDFVLVGDGPERPAIEQKLHDSSITNLKLAGYVTDKTKLLEHYAASNILVNHTRATPILEQIVFPAKTFEYFATGRPVVHAGRGWASDLLSARDVAEIVAPDDAAALAAGIERLLQEPTRARERAVRARELVRREYCREQLLEKLVQELDQRFARP
jgi:glycosyltransferase involved in cell wall biosynthesis